VTASPAPIQTLGPVTEARFAAAFADGATVTAKAAADLLGLDVKTLGALTDALTIRAVRRGKLRAYTEHDLRAYLLDGPGIGAADREKPWASGSRSKAGSGITNSGLRVVAFTDRPASKRAARPKR